MPHRNRIRQFVSDTFFVDGFPDDASFLRTGLIDSTGMMELVAFVEQEFSIQVADHELVPQNFDSLEKLNAFIERKRA
jgi:acyl carrier protein